MVTQTLYHFNKQIIEWKWSTDHELLKDPFWTSCFLIDGLLIDCAAPASEDDLRIFLNGLTEENKVVLCFITHNHEDHCGGGYLLQNEFNIPIISSKKAIPLINSEKDYPDYRQMTWGKKYKPFKAELIEDQITTKSGKYTFDLFPMDGHADELMALLEHENNWAFVTDAIMPKYKMIFGMTTDIPENIQKIHTSMNRLLDYCADWEDIFIITSGNGIFQGRGFIVDRINELEGLHQDAHLFKNEAIDSGVSEKRIPRYVLKKMFKKESFIGQFTRGGLSKSNLVLSLLEWKI